MTLAERIKAARAQAGMNQTELATACGWEWGSRIGNYEQGTKEPALEDIRSIAEQTGVRFVWLVAEDGPMTPETVHELKAAYTVTLTPDELAIVQYYRGMEEPGRRALRATGHALAQPADGPMTNHDGK